LWQHWLSDKRHCTAFRFHPKPYIQCFPIISTNVFVHNPRFGRVFWLRLKPPCSFQNSGFAIGSNLEWPHVGGPNGRTCKIAVITTGNTAGWSIGWLKSFMSFSNNNAPLADTHSAFSVVCKHAIHTGVNGFRPLLDKHRKTEEN